MKDSLLENLNARVKLSQDYKDNKLTDLEYTQQLKALMQECINQGN